MIQWKKKRKKALFGAGIEPSCSYCQHNGVKESELRDGKVVCTAHGKLQDGKCKKYVYDPLRREPRSAPPLRAGQFNQEDFKL